eukprot:CAMPEP_0194522808 /NCGR_PEP_ID=MMETSP0253-20130528/57519_1 /TAXON_ID=2966 /ORGANISM="Noctiluca scintillans" /LENGTH=432 /DNA_ID=CAMNT_0039367285 /DNA_START=91 /DNA_END=1389 /DNA_ORIENTATION=-
MEVLSLSAAMKTSSNNDSDEENVSASSYVPLGAVPEEGSPVRVDRFDVGVLVCFVALVLFAVLGAVKHLPLALRIIVTILALFLVCGILVQLVGSRALNSVIKNLVERYDQELLGVRVSVGRVTLSVHRCAVEVDEVIVQNPPGFGSEHLLRADGIKVALNIKSLIRSRGNTFEVDRIEVGSVRLHFVAKRGDTKLALLNVEHITQHMENSNLVKNVKFVRTSVKDSDVARKVMSLKGNTPSRVRDILLHYIGWSSVRVTSSLSCKHFGDLNAGKFALPRFQIEDVAEECNARTFPKIFLFVWKRFIRTIAEQKHIELSLLAKESLDRTSEIVQTTVRDMAEKVQGQLERASDRGHDVVERVGNDVGACFSKVQDAMGDSRDRVQVQCKRAGQKVQGRASAHHVLEKGHEKIEHVCRNFGRAAGKLGDKTSG